MSCRIRRTSSGACSARSSASRSRTCPYGDRLAALREAKVGLWDVIRSAERNTSSDSQIREAEAHDLAALIADMPDLGA